jgi:hypothetical protein|tara:strand:+ start:1635 stop:2135 length:501 start_codon:yes stop_codon:yes gene_type:complete
MRFPLTAFDSDAIVTTDIQVNAHNLSLRYSVAVTQGLVWPEFKALERKAELWKSTCLELFLSSPDDPAYLEINLSPCGGWNIYSFSSYRKGMKTAPGTELVDFRIERPGVITAAFDIDTLPDPVLFGPATILADKDGSLRYFSTKHGRTPDFHNREHHVLVAADDL